MAISIKDIREKQFSNQKHGYSIDEVDDFLDEIAEQVTELVRENMALKEQLDSAGTELNAARKAAVNAPVIVEKESAQPAIDDQSYFKDLQNAMRESLINANRIAEETRRQAEQEADSKISAAQIQADAITEDARAEVEACKAEAQALRDAAAKYRADFRKLVEDQIGIIKNREDLFD